MPEPTVKFVNATQDPKKYATCATVYLTISITLDQFTQVVVSLYWVYCWTIIQQCMLVVDIFHAKIRYVWNTKDIIQHSIECSIQHTRYKVVWIAQLFDRDTITLLFDNKKKMYLEKISDTNMKHYNLSIFMVKLNFWHAWIHFFCPLLTKILKALLNAELLSNNNNLHKL